MSGSPRLGPTDINAEHNNSVCTVGTVTNTTPNTSPVSQRSLAAGLKKALSVPPNDASQEKSTMQSAPEALQAVTNPANDGCDSEQKLADIMAAKSSEMIECLRDISQMVGTVPEKKNILQTASPNSDFDWSVILDASEKICQEYSQAMIELHEKQEEMQRDLSIWQESAFLMDGASVSDSLASLEEWCKAKETYLGHICMGMNEAGKVIDDVLSKLKSDAAKM
ncbi:Grand meiotic recombination cluster protein 2 [Cyberlindnera fabianii]|uniref:Grand meiotic recombination cluster protein 2 n=1 Tax=Cyberlindnera fabianii TaxID=36022 RepID=A0A1V2LB72_CYBFA|nr:Grand meiotic recombination cluster protein 2 [Cyberlindnera fabianii]